MDLFDKRDLTNTPLGQHQKLAGYFVFPELEGDINPRMKFNGKEVLVWSINNYLGMANHPKIRKVDIEATRDFGLAYPMGSRLLTGQTGFHKKLEDELAEFTQKEESYLLNYGYQGMLSLIDSLVDRSDVIVYDSEAHACIFDGIRLHIGKRFVFHHNDMNDLEKQLNRADNIVKKTQGSILVITEGVFGMSGDLGKLDEIIKLKSRFEFRLLVDDAHGFGTMGKTGAGTGEHFGVQESVDLYFSTFAKSMAGIGAFVSGEKRIIEYLRYTMRSQIFAKALPVPLVIGGLERLHVLKSESGLREKLWRNVDKLQSGLKKAGFDLGKTESPVTPVYLHGSTEEAIKLNMDLRENFSIFCSLVIYPVVPKGIVMIRIIPTAQHTDNDVDYTIDAFKEISNNLKSGKYQ
ncbi:aminotransferase class I/II-fold pyridoxal phosphate-dependent enzyme [Saccharicrinis sp. FJH2]|uniref:aminotransferase class I/II-fold pyridoxal phosphate-dependent enzyme n=1 Tax=Saccharicrinis sp. FJH65 TaxID=3344659 RepID=UPI0035F34D3D